jgi:hypothetical protein
LIDHAYKQTPKPPSTPASGLFGLVRTIASPALSFLGVATPKPEPFPDSSDEDDEQEVANEIDEDVEDDEEMEEENTEEMVNIDQDDKLEIVDDEVEKPSTTSAISTTADVVDLTDSEILTLPETEPEVRFNGSES